MAVDAVASEETSEPGRPAIVFCASPLLIISAMRLKAFHAREMHGSGEQRKVSMRERLQYGKACPDVYKAMLALSQAVEKTGLARQLIDLVDYRVSQLNGCAFCLDMHSKDLRAAGETEQRLYMISAWRDAPHLYSDRERAALAWAEAVTRLEGQQVPDPIYDTARQEFSEDELTQLTLAIVAINGWNRFNVAFRMPAGDYKVGGRA